MELTFNVNQMSEESLTRTYWVMKDLCYDNWSSLRELVKGHHHHHQELDSGEERLSHLGRQLTPLSWSSLCVLSRSPDQIEKVSSKADVLELSSH